MSGSVSPPNSVIVIGGGIVGLSTAWYLQEHGIEVTVVDRGPVGGGASWGNAGWVVPGLVTPLAEPGGWKHGVEALFRKDAPVSIPPRFDPALWRFLARFSRNMTAGRWRRTVECLQPLVARALDAFGELHAAGAAPAVIEAPYSVGFRSPAAADHYRNHLEELRGMGQPVEYVNGFSIPQFSAEVTDSLRVMGQGFIDPGAYVVNLAASVKQRGGRILENWPIHGVADTGSGLGVSVVSADGGTEVADAVVLATGASIPRLGRAWGLRTPLQPGRGYSFTVDCELPLDGPLYLPAERVVLTPYAGAVRVAGTMEFAGFDDPLNTARLDSVAAAAKPMVRGIDWSTWRDFWVGPRPVTADGLPVLGALRSPRIFANGGHGMWGIVLGPVSGRLLAGLIAEGCTPIDLAPFNPLRR
ncbi:FAD-dependent oxidoreductase [Arthrobacter yangruifuii]|uniref:FAD-dependent oxidoreductase n=1 Tax=Arthrobacter yangruifuii TaxID=2606616 RepID=A0A5N6MEF4_9MICC|nr:FAD-dependent oxidoreductase [Arthrobacter yangruifuii]KAD3455955.1 FAD-dependent oxidoreductase [Arthrobacter yangruifuii]